MANYLVTGVAGFIGRSIAAALLAEGHAVRGIDNFITGRRENLAGLEALELIEASLNDPGSAALACRDVEVVFHQAAIPSVPRSVKDPLTTNEANVDATLQLLVSAHEAKVRRVIYAGSSSAYGNTPTLPKVETMTPAPISPYAVSKYAGELYMQSFWQVYGLETVVLRYFNIFGPYQDPTSHYSGVLAKFVTQMLAGGTPTIFGDGEQSRDFTYIDNAVQANLLAAAAPAEKVAGKAFNIACGERIPLNHVVELLRGLTGYIGPVYFAPERAGDIKHSLADISLAKDKLGYAPTVDFGEGLRRTVDWYKHPAAAQG